MNLPLLRETYFKTPLFPDKLETCLNIPNAKVASFNRRGTMLAVGSSVGMIEVYNFDTLECHHTLLKTHESPIISIGFSRNSQNILSASSDGWVRLWRIKDGKKLYESHFDEHIVSTQYHPRDTDKYLVCRGELRPLLVSISTGSQKILTDFGPGAEEPSTTKPTPDNRQSMQPTPDDMQGIQEGKNATDPEKAEGQNAIDLCTDVTLDADTTDAQKPTHTDTRPMQSTKDTSMTKNQIATQNATDTTQNATNMKEKTQNAIDLGTGVSQAAADINTDQSSAATTQQEEHKHPADQQITDHAQNATNTKEKSQNAIDFGTGVSQAAVDLNTDQSSAAAIRQEGHKQSADQQITDHTQNATDLESNEPPTQALDTEHSQNGSVHDPEHAQNATDMELAQILAAAETAEDTLKEGTDSMVDASGSNGMGTRDNTPNIIPSNTPDISITDGEPDVGIGRKRSRTAEGDLQGSDIDDDRTETDRHMHTGPGSRRKSRPPKSPNKETVKKAQKRKRVSIMYVATFDCRGKRIACGRSDGHLALVDTNTFEIVRTHEEPQIRREKLIGLTYGVKDGPLLVNSGSIMRGYVDDLQTCIFSFQELVERKRWSTALVSSDGMFVVSGSERRHHIYVWDIQSGVLVKALEGPGSDILEMKWHPTRPTLITITETGMFVWTVNFTENWVALAANFTEIDANIAREEREDENDFATDFPDNKYLTVEFVMDRDAELAMQDICAKVDIPGYYSSDEEGCPPDDEYILTMNDVDICSA